MNASPVSEAAPHRSLLVLSVLVGLGADLLVRDHVPDARTSLGLALPAAGMAIVAYRHEVALSTPTRAWLGISLVVAALLSGRAAPFLTFLTLLGWIGCVVMATWSARGGTPFRAQVTELPRQAFGTALHAAFGAPGLLSRALAAPSRPGASAAQDRIPRVLSGAILAAPLLVLFGALFAAADPVFRQGLQAFTRIDLTAFGVHATSFLVAAWAAAGIGRRFLLGTETRDPQWLELGARPPSQAPNTEVATALGLIALLFLAFVGVQVRYLFGNHELVQQTVGLTYAEYARRGFFELFAVAVVLLPVLLLADWALAQSEDRRALRAWTTVLLLLLAVILASAFQRMHLYTEAYGWTTQRLYAVAALAWVCLVTAIFAATVLRTERLRFAGPSATAALITLGVLHLINPDAFVARNQLARAASGQALDFDHLRHLGPDAFPVLVERLPSLPEEHRTALTGVLESRRASLSAWSHAHWAARRALETLAPHHP